MTRKISSVLVTGGAGFIGSHIVDRLTRDGRKLRILDNLSTGKTENLATHIRENSVEFVEGDVRDTSMVNELSSDTEAIIHLAALADHETCLRDPDLANDVNARGTLTMLEAARRHDIRSFVYASSAALYGEASNLPISEEAKLAPIAPYGSSKLAGEEHCLRYFQNYGLRTKCLRFFNVFGPRQSARQYSGVITEFMKRLKTTNLPSLTEMDFKPETS